MRYQALALIAACGSGGGFPDAAVKPPQHPGTFALSWTLQDGSGQPVTCATANATTVHVGITDANTGSRVSQSFDCGLASGVSGALFVATYNLDFTLVGSAGTIATGAPQSGLAIVSDKTTTVPAATFTVTP